MTRKEYVRMNDAEEAKKAVERWRELHWSRRKLLRVLRDFSRMSEVVVDWLEGRHDRVYAAMVRDGSV